MKKFLVATWFGGPTQDTYFYYDKYQVIEAETADEAVKNYNKLNKRAYFYAHCIGEIDENTKTVAVPVEFFIKR